MRALLLPALTLSLVVACNTDNTLHDRNPPIEEPEEDTAVPVEESPPDDTPADSPPDDPPPVACTPGEPIANAGPDQTVSPLFAVLLSGIGSTDPGGCLPLTYKWSVLSKPPGSTTGILNGTTREIRPFLDIAGTYVFKLEVKNSLGTWDPTPDEVTVQAVPTQAFYAQLTWDTDVDLDLHVLDGSGDLFKRPGDVCWCNPNPSWGAATATDDPSLDNDEVNGFGPETTTIRAPSAGTLDIRVHYYGANGSVSCTTCPTTTATLKTFNQATLLQTYTQVLTDQGQVWKVAIMDWPSEVITPDGTIETTTLSVCN